MTPADVDCLIIGGGPAGLSAAIYVSRFHLSTLVIDAGGGRAAHIPRTRNHAGFPDGISGQALLARMRVQAENFGARVLDGLVTEVRGQAGDFLVRAGDASFGARAVLLCSGVTNHRPGMPDALHARAVAEGRIRYCPVCDGFEVTDMAVAVIGSGSRAAREARFLRAYTERVTLIGEAATERLSGVERKELAQMGVALVAGPPEAFDLTSAGLALRVAGRTMTFDTAYPALGSTVHSGLAARLGAALTEEGCVKVDEHQRTTVMGLYAAGDVVVGLDQISHAMGEAGVAATAIRNDLSARKPLLRVANLAPGS